MRSERPIIPVNGCEYHVNSRIEEKGDDPFELLRVLVHHPMSAAGDLDNPCTWDSPAENKCIRRDADNVISPVQDQCRRPDIREAGPGPVPDAHCL